MGERPLHPHMLMHAQHTPAGNIATAAAGPFSLHVFTTSTSRLYATLLISAVAAVSCTTTLVMGALRLRLRRQHRAAWGALFDALGGMLLLLPSCSETKTDRCVQRCAAQRSCIALPVLLLVCTCCLFGA